MDINFYATLPIDGHNCLLHVPRVACWVWGIKVAHNPLSGPNGISKEFSYFFINAIKQLNDFG